MTIRINVYRKTVIEFENKMMKKLSIYKRINSKKEDIQPQVGYRYPYLYEKKEGGDELKKSAESENKGDGELDEGQLQIEFHQGEAIIEAGEMSEEIVNVDDDDGQKS